LPQYIIAVAISDEFLKLPHWDSVFCMLHCKNQLNGTISVWARGHTKWMTFYFSYPKRIADNTA